MTRMGMRRRKEMRKMTKNKVKKEKILLNHDEPLKCDITTTIPSTQM